jgi:hypothetical protein
MARPSEKRGFRYNQRSKEDLRERANMKGGDFDSIIKPKYKVYKPHDGKNVVRVLPPTWEGAKHYGFDVFVNYNIGVDNQSYLSLAKMKGEADPLAEARREAERSGDKDLAKALAPRMRIGMWVIDRVNEDEGPLLWLAPFTLDKAIANLSFDEDTKEVVFIDDPENGCDVRFYKEGTGLKTDYDASKIRILKPSPLHDDEGIQAEWLEYVQENPIPDCLQYYDYDHISAAFDGTVANKDKDAEEEKPRSRKSAVAADDDDVAPPHKRAAAPVVDDDDDTPPVRGRSRVTEPVDDDDAEAPPPRKRAAAADDDDDAPPARSSIRDRLQTRRSRIEAED